MEDIRMNIKEMKTKELYNMLKIAQRDTLFVLKAHYKMDGGSIWEDCGLIRFKEIKKNANKVFSIRFNRKEIIKHIMGNI